MSLLSSILILFGLIFLIFLLAHWKPDFFFWLFFIFSFDPGGIFENYFLSKLVGKLNASDVFFFLMLVIFLSVKNKAPILNRDENFRKIFRYLIFVGFYFVFVYGLIIPIYYGRENFIFFLQKNRLFIMAYPAMYIVYFFAQRSIETFFKLLVFVSFVFLTLYLITLTTGIEIIPVMEFERFGGTGIMRKAMLSYGLMDWMLYFGIIIYYLRKKVDIKIKINRIVIYYCALLMAITILITLTRRDLINIIVFPLLIILFISYLFKLSKTVAVFKIIFPAILVYILLSVIFPEYTEFVQKTYEDIAYQILPAESPGAEKDYRVAGEGDMKYVFQIFKEHRLFGIGAVTMLWSDVVFAKQMGDTFAMALDAGAEVPLYGAFMHFGIVGVSILIPIIFILMKYVITLIKIIRKDLEVLLRRNPIKIIILIYLISVIIFRFIVGLGNFSDFLNPLGTFNLYSLLGMLYGLSREYYCNDYRSNTSTLLNK